MKLIKWLLPIIFIAVLAPNSFAQIYPNDSTTILNLRDQLGLSNTGGLSSNNVSSWVPTYIDTVYDPTSSSYRITRINFGGLSSSTSPSILPPSIFDGDNLTFVQTLLLDNIGIDSIGGFLRPNTTGPSPTLKEIDISSNNFSSGNSDFFRYLTMNIASLEVLKANTALATPTSAFSSYTLVTSSQLKHLDIRNNNLTGILDVEGLITSRYPNLEFLYASYNPFTGLQVPSSPITSTAFKKLHIEGLLLQDFKPIEVLLNTIPSLQWLYARNLMDTANIQDSLEFTLSNPHASIRTFDISFNRLVGKLPLDILEKMPNIETLYLNNNRIRGSLPNPPNTVGAPFNNNGYLGLSKLRELDLSNNNLKGELRIDWLFLAQLAELANQGTNMPLEDFYASNNHFNRVTPALNHINSTPILTNVALNNRFAALKELELQGNKFDFRDLFRVKRILRLKQVSGTVYNHYIPQSGIDSTAFFYAPQEALGIGGVRRRTPGSRITFTAGIGIVAAEQTSTNYIDNKYAWERIDTANIQGGSPSNPVVQTIGLAEQIGGLTAPNLAANNIIGDSTYLLGVDTTAANIHRLGVQHLDSSNHHKWLYRAKIENDSFPALTLYTLPKKIEVGYCVDSSGAPIHCQSIIVQFHPDTLALYSPQEQDSIKQALRTELGAEPIDQCLCGDIELWSISDTASTMLEANGKGTKKTASKASGKPQLLSADPNYSLLSGTTNPLPDTVNLPTGSGNTTAKTLVAIIDSGVDYDYPALTPYLSEGVSTANSCLPSATFGYNFLGDNNNATDDHGHGTSVAGIVAGISQRNILPDTGAMQTDIGILPLKYTDKEGSGSLFHAACAFRYAADYQRTTTTGETAKVRVINASWGYYGDPCIVLENTLTYVGKDCGILIVASAGNDSRLVQGNLANRHWPSNSIWDTTGLLTIDNILAVAGLNFTATALHPGSNYGNIHIDIAAPWYENTPLAGSTNGFIAVEGTSFAAPQVSRAAALLFDKYPDATYFAVKYALLHGVDTLQHLDSAKIASKGRINYHKADSILNRIVNKTLCAETGFVLNNKLVQISEVPISIYPNPVMDNLTIAFDYSLHSTKMELSLFNIQGQRLQHRRLPLGTTNTTISTKELVAGVYFIQLTLGDKQYSQKIIKF